MSKYDVNEDDLGIRAFQLRKERAVERAIEKIRYNLNSDWEFINDSDINLLEWGLGETWAMVGFNEWNNISFSSLKLEEVQNIIEISKKVLDHKKPGLKGTQEISSILKTH